MNAATTIHDRGVFIPPTRICPTALSVSCPVAVRRCSANQRRVDSRRAVSTVRLGVSIISHARVMMKRRYVQEYLIFGDPKLLELTPSFFIFSFLVSPIPPRPEFPLHSPTCTHTNPGSHDANAFAIFSPLAKLPLDDKGTLLTASCS